MNELSVTGACRLNGEKGEEEVEEREPGFLADMIRAAVIYMLTE
jgi:hypothetical protein